MIEALLYKKKQQQKESSLAWCEAAFFYN